MNEAVITQIKEWIEAIIFAGIAAGILFIVCWPAKIDGASMENTFFTNERIAFSRALAYFDKLDYGDIVICRLNENGYKRNIVKRLIAKPLDHVELSSSVLKVNGEAVDESYLSRDFEERNLDIILGEEEYFILGDNRDVSIDSRSIGPVHKKDLVGKVLFRWFPFNKITAY